MDLSQLKRCVEDEILVDLADINQAPQEGLATPPTIHPKQLNPLILDEVLPKNGARPRSKSVGSPSSPGGGNRRSGSFSSSAGGSPVIRGKKSNSRSTPSFLSKLYRMLCYEDPTLVEWKNGVIFVHNPEKLSSEILPKYFRHNKFTSFQRQLNYFGFRKVSKKGSKMSPCAYSNEGLVGKDLDIILTVQRRTNVTESDLFAMDSLQVEQLENHANAPPRAELHRESSWPALHSTVYDDAKHPYSGGEEKAATLNVTLLDLSPGIPVRQDQNLFASSFAPMHPHYTLPKSLPNASQGFLSNASSAAKPRASTPEFTAPATVPPLYVKTEAAIPNPPHHHLPIQKNAAAVSKRVFVNECEPMSLYSSYCAGAPVVSVPPPIIFDPLKMPFTPRGWAMIQENEDLLLSLAGETPRATAPPPPTKPAADAWPTTKPLKEEPSSQTPLAS